MSRDYPESWENCKKGGLSWWCSRWSEHDGPCALRPRWWNLVGRWKSR